MSNERELSWDDQIEKDGGDFILLPEGDYNFTVSKFERARFAGSAKMPACNQAKLELTVHSPEYGEVTIFHNLFLHTKTEGLLSNFFAGIGQKKKGEPLRMNWGAVVGARGRLKLIVNTYKGNDGNEKTNNQVSKFYSPEELGNAPQPNAPQPPQQQYQQAPPQQASYQQPPYQQQQSYQQPPVQQPQQQAPFPTNQTGGFTPGQF